MYVYANVKILRVYWRVCVPECMYTYMEQSNSTGAAGVFDESTVARQLRQLDVPDTLALFKYGMHHRPGWFCCCRHACCRHACCRNA